MELFHSILTHSTEIAIHPNHTYSELAQSTAKIVFSLGDIVQETKIGILCGKNIGYVSCLLACFLSGAVAVPIDAFHTRSEIAYSIQEAEVSILIYSHEYEDMSLELLAEFPILRLYRIEELLTPRARIALSLEMMSEQMDGLSDLTRGCLMIFTSASTGNPKGVVHTLGSVNSQMNSLIEAWKITSSDRILHVLPVDYLDGTVNAILTILRAGGCIEFSEKENVWSRLTSAEEEAITLFMAEPAIYSKLLLSPYKTKLTNVRLCISGLVALPSLIRENWISVTGKLLIEGYGTTEIGMAFQIDSSVGFPLPGVNVKLINPKTGIEIINHDDDGEIYVSSLSLFREYYNHPEGTATVLTNGWFKTGNIAYRSSHHSGAYFIRKF